MKRVLGMDDMVMVVQQRNCILIPLNCTLKNGWDGNSLAVQWLGLCASTTGDTGSVPGQGIKILHTLWCIQINKHQSLKKKKSKYSLTKKWLRWLILWCVFYHNKKKNTFTHTHKATSAFSHSRHAQWKYHHQCGMLLWCQFILLAHKLLAISLLISDRKSFKVFICGFSLKHHCKQKNSSIIKNRLLILK